MARRRRRLVVGSQRFVWSVDHTHDAADSPDGGRRRTGCRETVRIWREDAPGHLAVVFEAGADAFPHSGAVRRPDGHSLNLNEPGVVRALLDETLARGWQAAAPGRAQFDGWALFDAVVARHAGRGDDVGTDSHPV
ncbi:hypothetical protein [Polymorphospora sp. NPDC050346]|uniref:hypothetical protein n=1 Tax=Polymorphospora sp. NPDC050346 TaxID=3155780 RepID=UPI0033E4FFDE